MPVDPIQVDPVPTHITGISDDARSALFGLAGETRKCLHHVIPRTVVLTADTPVDQLLKPDPNREWVVIIARTNPVVLTESKGNGQAAANVGDPTGANPNGAMIPANTVIKMPAITSELWAAAATYPTPVSVIACYRKD